MTTPGFDPYNPARFQAPTPPQEFGQDGGHFYRHYDALAEEIDDNYVNELKEQLEGLLIFATDETTPKAGLFAGINTAFLLSSLPSPTDRTNILLQNTNTILLNIALGTNYGLPYSLSPPGRPVEWFPSDFPSEDPWDSSFWFSISLTLTLISSFFLILGREWLIYYRKRSGGGPDRQRWEQLKRFLGAKRRKRPCLRYREFASILVSRFPRLRRREEDNELLQIIAIRRALRTSDDVPTQTHAVANILAITDANTLGGLAIDYEFIELV
ncbi:hypothetical protein FRC00_002700 [Tulasnella sp. 408]|nr:hypothetical protein FRC00_002700 [Tulasnella sp. 408]